MTFFVRCVTLLLRIAGREHYSLCLRTYKYKLQSHKRNRHLQDDVRVISQVDNHFVALTRRHYRVVYCVIMFRVKKNPMLI